MKISKRKDGYYRTSIKTPDGKYKSIYGKTKREVKEKAEKLIADIQTDNYVKNNKTTLENYSKLWIETYCNHLSESTVKEYKFDLKNHINRSLGNMELQKIKRSDVQQFINNMSESLSPKTVKNIYHILASILKNAERDELINKSPAQNISLPKLKTKERLPLEIDQMYKLLEISKNTRYEEVIEFLLLTGLRIGELIGLKRDCIDLENKIIIIKRQYSDKLNKLTLPKHSKIREVPLPKRAIEILENYLSLNGDLVFIQRSGKGKGNKLNQRAFNRELKRLGSLIGRSDLSAHILRHTYGTILLEAGISPKVIQSNLGHFTSDFTLKVYTHATEKGKNLSAEILDKIFE